MARHLLRSWLCCLAMLGLPAAAQAQLSPAPSASYVSARATAGAFSLVGQGQAAPFIVGTGEWPGVLRAVQNLRTDVQSVTGRQPALSTNAVPAGSLPVLIGTLGHSTLIDRLVQTHRLDTTGLAGRWETFVIQIVEQPLPGVRRALVVAGSDKRGTIYGLYDLSAQIGVSPWQWWADVPVRAQPALYVRPGRHSQGTPGVKYRGIFLNDEAPALSGWAKKTFGGFNHQFYERVFELLLRLKGNYLWPAMWGNAFYDDDPQSPVLADEMGVVIGTSHHEPLMRAHDEWRRYGKGPWNYQKNDTTLRDFWRKSIRRMGTNESIVSVGMRGDGDEPMSRESNTALLERIVADQRTILREETGKDPAATPQLWALYKEVQDYYDKGMRVPDDVTLLLCDDNWGNIRKLPEPRQRRAGGYGIYYHFDYVGGPRNYKWLNTNPIARTWEQMHLAYRHGVDRIWIVNVGDLKPMEFPISFFLDYAWAPDRWSASQLPTYTRLWAAQQFGPAHAAAIARILTTYTQYNSRRKPELLAPTTYSQVNFREAERIASDYNQLLSEAEAIGRALPPAYQAAYFQLVLHPVKACATLNDLYVTAGRNGLYARQRRASTNALADRAATLFARDAAIGRYYNDTLSAGKWQHLMDQTHIGYTYWQQPDKNTMPAVVRLTVPAEASLGVAIPGSEDAWPGATARPVLPTLTPRRTDAAYIEVFNRGATPFSFRATTTAPYLHISPATGPVATDQRLWLTVDWAKVPVGRWRVPITITGPGEPVVVEAVIEQVAPALARQQARQYVETDGWLSIPATGFSQSVANGQAGWQRVPALGRTGDGMMPVPVTAPAATPGPGSPRLDYPIYLAQPGPVQVYTYLSPTLNLIDNKGLRYAVSIDDEAPQLIDIHAGETNRRWEQSVANNIRVLTSTHAVEKAGAHTLHYWLVDPAVVLQKIVVGRGTLPNSYLGPPERDLTRLTPLK